MPQAANGAPLLRRAFLFLEELSALAADLDENPDFKKVIRFGDEEEQRDMLLCRDKCRENAERQAEEAQAQAEEKEKQKLRRKQWKKIGIIAGAARWPAFFFSLGLCPP